MKKLSVLIVLSIFTLPVLSWATIHQVYVSNVLTPDTLQNVYVGDTVRFIWAAEGHSMMGGHPTAPGELDFQLNDFETFDYKVTKAGEYNYTCYPHGNFAGYFNAMQPQGFVKCYSSEYLISPNPSSGIFYFNNYSENIELHLTVSDIIGKLIIDQKTDLQVQSAIDLSSYKKGIYFLKVSDSRGSVYNSRLVKQ